MTITPSPDRWQPSQTTLTVAELMRAAGVTPVPNDEGHISLDTKSAVAKYIATAKKHKIWAREPSVSPNV